MYKPIKGHGCNHAETSQSIWKVKQVKDKQVKKHVKRKSLMSEQYSKQGCK